jgi:hypothetical protein
MVTVDDRAVTIDPGETRMDGEATHLLVFGGARWLGMAGDGRGPGGDSGARRPQILGSAHGPRILEILNGVAA